MPGTMQALYPVLGRLPARVQGQPDRQAARAAGAVAGDRPPADHRACDERQGAACPIRSRPSATPSISTPTSWKTWADEAYRYDPALAKQDPGGGRLSERVRAELRQHGAAGHAVHGRYRHRRRRHVDQDRRQGEAQDTTNGARSRRWSEVIRRISPAAPRCTAPSAGRTCPGATRAPSRRTATSICSATRTICQGPARRSTTVYRELLAERDPAKRTALTDRMVELVAEHLDRGADHRGHGLLRDQRQAGRPVRRDPRPARTRRRVRAHPASREKPWKK